MEAGHLVDDEGREEVIGAGRYGCRVNLQVVGRVEDGLFKAVFLYVEPDCLAGPSPLLGIFEQNLGQDFPCMEAEASTTSAGIRKPVSEYSDCS